MSDLSNDAAEAGAPKRVIVLLRKDEAKAKSESRRRWLVYVAAVFMLLAGLVLGYRGAALISPPDIASREPAQTTERVKGGLYALELATPRGNSRWMLEFDAEIITNDGPKNPVEMRNALEDLVITATSMPLVQSSDDPELAMREAMLAVAAQNYPWLIDIYMTRSDIRADSDRLGGIGRALRSLYKN